MALTENVRKIYKLIRLIRLKQVFRFKINIQKSILYSHYQQETENVIFKRYHLQ